MRGYCGTSACAVDPIVRAYYADTLGSKYTVLQTLFQTILIVLKLATDEAVYVAKPLTLALG